MMYDDLTMSVGLNSCIAGKALRLEFGMEGMVLETECKR
jgi:hypothetical protein